MILPCRPIFRWDGLGPVALRAGFFLLLTTP